MYVSFRFILNDTLNFSIMPKEKPNLNLVASFLIFKKINILSFISGSCFVQKRLKFLSVAVLNWICPLYSEVPNMRATKKLILLYGRL